MTTQVLDRTAERKAYIKGMTGDPVPVMSAPGNAAPMRTGGLGPSQLEWCRAKWPVFAVCERQALAAEQHRQELIDAVKS